MKKKKIVFSPTHYRFNVFLSDVISCIWMKKWIFLIFMIYLSYKHYLCEVVSPKASSSIIGRHFGGNNLSVKWSMASKLTNHWLGINIWSWPQMDYHEIHLIPHFNSNLSHQANDMPPTLEIFLVGNIVYKEKGIRFFL